MRLIVLVGSHVEGGVDTTSRSDDDEPQQSGGMQQNDLAAILARLRAGGAERVPPLSLNDIIKGDVVIPLLEGDTDALRTLLEFLPEGQQTDHEALEVIRSPQLQQAMAVLTYALNSGAGGAILSDLSIDPHTAPGVVAFLRALQGKITPENSRIG